MLGDFTRRYPAISLTILTGNENVNMQRTGIDLALYFDDTPPANLTHHFLMDEAILPVCSPAYAREHDLLKHPAHLSHCTLLHDRRPEQRFRYRRMAELGGTFCSEHAIIIGHWLRSF